MAKIDIIIEINSAIKSHDLDFDLVPEDSKDKVKDLKDLLADVNDAATEKTAPPTVTVAQLCKELEKDPKSARAKLRRLYAKDDVSDLPVPVVGKQRWTFAEEDRDALTALISNE